MKRNQHTSAKPIQISDFTHAPTHSYWVYTEKGAKVHNNRPGAIIDGNPYRAPNRWVDEGFVVFENLE